MIQELLTPEIQKFIEDHLRDDPAKLMLMAGRYPDWPMKKIVEQIQARQIAKSKLPGWSVTKGLIYPPPVSMEQCSSEQTAEYKASIVTGGTIMADLTGGFGVDFSHLSKRFEQALYVEKDPGLAAMAGHNFEVLGLTYAEVLNMEANVFLDGAENLDLVYLDPARRDDHNRKVVRLEDCEPNVLELLPALLSRSKQVLLKTSPLLDIKSTIRQLEHVRAVHVVAVNNEVKELLFLIEPGAREPGIKCLNLLKHGQELFEFSFNREESLTLEHSPFGSHLYEPNAAILKAGAFKSVADQFGLQKLHANTHLYTSDQVVSQFPGRVFSIMEGLSMNKKALRKAIPEMKANITVRNFPMTVTEIRKKSGLKEGGNKYLFGLTDVKGRHLLLCEKVDHK